MFSLSLSLCLCLSLPLSHDHVLTIRPEDETKYVEAIFALEGMLLAFYKMVVSLMFFKQEFEELSLGRPGSEQFTPHGLGSSKASVVAFLAIVSSLFL
jgi:hypothetical protein